MRQKSDISERSVHNPSEVEGVRIVIISFRNIAKNWFFPSFDKKSLGTNNYVRTLLKILR